MSITVPTYYQSFAVNFYGASSSDATEGEELFQKFAERNDLKLTALDISTIDTNLTNINTLSKADIKTGDTLFQRFLNSSGYTEEQVDTLDINILRTAYQTFLQDIQAQIRVEYSFFLAEELGAIYQTESIVALSPDEMIKRNILFETFSIVLKMLNSLQDALRTASNSLVFYTKWQEQYTTMMSKIPLYTPGITSGFIFDPVDIGKSYIGYGGRLEDVAKYLVHEVYAGTNSAIETSGSLRWLDYNTYAIKFRVYYDTSTRQIKLIIADNNPNGSQGWGIFSSNGDGFTSLANSPQIDATGSNITTIVSTLLSLLNTDFHTKHGEFGLNIYLDRVPPLPSYTTYQEIRNALINNRVGGGTPWSEITGISGNTDTDKMRSGQRGELNGRLQLMIENTRSLRQRVRDLSKPIENLVSSIRESIQSQSNLLSSITESMRGIIGSIFR